MSARTDSTSPVHSPLDFDLTENEAVSNDGIDEDDELEDAQRPGRYHGADFNWKYLVQGDISVADALACDDNDNLSIHLYNTYKYKIRQRKSRGRFSDSSLGGELGAEERVYFEPPQAWTEWPMSSEDVPRSREHWGRIGLVPSEAVDTFTKLEAWRPGIRLQDEVLAILRRAISHGRSRRLEAHYEPFTSGATTTSPARANDGRRNSSSSSISSAASHELAHPSHPQQEYAVNKSRLDATTTTPGDYSLLVEDDDLSKEILQPISTHILTMVDSLLTTLHKSRSCIRTRNTGSRDISRRRSRSKLGSRLRGPGAAAERGSIANEGRAESLDRSSDSSPERDHSPALNPASKAKYVPRVRQRPSGPRDWKDLLSFAALSGWDPRALDRASQRCAAIFQDGLEMPLSPDAIAHNSNGQGCPPSSVVHFRQPFSHAKPSNSLQSSRGVEAHFDEGQQRGSFVKRKFGPGIQSPLLTANAEAALQDQTRSRLYPCPHDDCSHHRDAFQWKWQMHEHLKLKHEGQRTQSSQSQIDRRTEPQSHSLEEQNKAAGSLMTSYVQ